MDEEEVFNISLKGMFMGVLLSLPIWVIIIYILKKFL